MSKSIYLEPILLQNIQKAKLTENAEYELFPQTANTIYINAKRTYPLDKILV